MHHANLLVGDEVWAMEQIPESERVESNDICIRSYERMNIADARAIVYETNLRPVSRPYRTFIFICNSILLEAQNALLKLLEEPNSHTLFYFIVPREDMIIPTLRSRFHLLGSFSSVASPDNFMAFLKNNYRDRITSIAERIKSEDQAWVASIFSGFVAYAHTTKNPQYMQDGILFESYIHAPGSSKKMLLEHLALSLDVA